MDPDELWSRGRLQPPHNKTHLTWLEDTRLQLSHATNSYLSLRLNRNRNLNSHRNKERAPYKPKIAISPRKHKRQAGPLTILLTIKKWVKTHNYSQVIVLNLLSSRRLQSLAGQPKIMIKRKILKIVKKLVQNSSISRNRSTCRQVDTAIIVSNPHRIHSKK